MGWDLNELSCRSRKNRGTRVELMRPLFIVFDLRAMLVALGAFVASMLLSSPPVAKYASLNDGYDVNERD